MFCIYCGKQIEHTSHFCQYCGKSVTPSPAPAFYSNQKQNNITPAIIGLAVSLIGIAITSILPYVGAVVGVSASIAAIIICSLQRKEKDIKPVAITGFSLGIIGVILSIAIIACHIAASLT